MSTPGQPPVTTWQVTGSRERVKIAPDGTPVEGIEVSYLTGLGGTGTVFVSTALATADTVRMMVQAAAEKTDAINTLTSGG